MNATRETASRVSRMAKVNIAIYVAVIAAGVVHAAIGPGVYDRIWGGIAALVAVGAIFAQRTIINLCKTILTLTERGAA